MLLILLPVFSCLPWALFLSAAVFACLCFVGLFVLFLGVVLYLAALSLLRLIR